jgi:hypothetical protein
MKRMLLGFMVFGVVVAGIAWFSVGPSGRPASPPAVTTTTRIKHGVTARIELEQTSLIQGSSAHAVLIVDNNSGKPFDLGFCGIGAQLVNDQVTYEDLPMPACDRMAMPGESRTTFTLHANKPACEVLPKASQGPLLPPCEPQFLPVGTYHIAFPTNLAVPATNVTVTQFLK